MYYFTFFGYTVGDRNKPEGGREMKYDSIGANMRMFRMEKNLRQEDIAERAGLSANYIGMIERGEKIPSLEKFIAICNALHVSADQILADVLDTGYNVRSSMLTEKISKLSKQDRERLYAVIDAMIKHP